MDYDDIPLSQVYNEAFETNQALRQPSGPTNFTQAFQEDLLNAQPGAGSGLTQPNGHQPFRINTEHGKLINDPIHGAYRLDAQCTTIFDTRPFQRLRRLKQLGLTYFVFPGASHNRFEHSLGVAHLAYKFANQLWQAQRHELTDITRRDLRNVELAGLCHDLGHGPYSHVFEREFLSQKGITNWEHEKMSSDMLQYIIDDNYIDTISDDDIRRVKGLITAGHTHGTQNCGPRWLGEIVANGRNNIDVDKFDYLARDSMYCGVKISCDFNRIMQFSRVIDDEICYKATEYLTLYELFQSRASMHRAVYTHKKAKAVEFMVVDALLAADPVLKISDRIWKPEEFTMLDDGLLEMIENFELLRPMLNLDSEAEHALKESQAIISRLRKRQLYKYVTDALIPQEVVQQGHWKRPTEADIVDSYHGSEIHLRPEDIILQETCVDFSMKSTNPLDKVSFYDYLDSTESRPLRHDQISSMVVANFQDQRLRVYSRNGDPKYVNAVHDAFKAWIHRRFGGEVHTSTPAKETRPRSDLPVLGGGGVNKRSRNLFNAPLNLSQGSRGGGSGMLPPRPPSSQGGGGGGSQSREASPVRLTRSRKD